MTPERIVELRENGMVLEHHGIAPSGADWIADDEWKELCELAHSASGAIALLRALNDALLPIPDALQARLDAILDRAEEKT